MRALQRHLLLKTFTLLLEGIRVPFSSFETAGQTTLPIIKELVPWERVWKEERNFPFSTRKKFFEKMIGFEHGIPKKDLFSFLARENDTSCVLRNTSRKVSLSSKILCLRNRERRRGHREVGVNSCFYSRSNGSAESLKIC